MRSLTYLVTSIPALKDYLNSTVIRENTSASKSILIQIFSSLSDKNMLDQVTDALLSFMPGAVIVGSTSVGEIIHGHLEIGTIVVSMSFFTDTVLNAIEIDEPSGREKAAGEELISRIVRMEGNVAGMLMLATALSIDISKLFTGMASEDFSFPVFGGSAGVYNPNLKSMIFLGKKYICQGAIAVIFISDNLQIRTRTFLGWNPLSKELTVTEADGLLLKTIDGERAFDVYNRYLDIPNDENFFNNALEFPILVKRNGEWIARVPFFANEDGYIGFLADIKTGEKFHIGYGDPDSILRNSYSVQRELYNFAPESIFIYACICRRFLLQNSVNLETQSFDAIAPTAGFYTYGEFISSGNNIQLLNSTIVVAAFREGKEMNPDRPAAMPLQDSVIVSQEEDPFSNKHSRIVAKLLHFISVVTLELENANSELKRLSGIDKLTQISNRLRLDEILQDEFKRKMRYETDFSVLILDLDHFKRINDDYGHPVGDMVLKEIADILKANMRACDTVGRWGGEEFMVILPETTLKNACTAAEKIRAAVENSHFPVAVHMTCSLGVATCRMEDDQDRLLCRADIALYDAKKNGRNQVSCERDDS